MTADVMETSYYKQMCVCLFIYCICVSEALFYDIRMALLKHDYTGGHRGIVVLSALVLFVFSALQSNNNSCIYSFRNTISYLMHNR